MYVCMFFYCLYVCMFFIVYMFVCFLLFVCLYVFIVCMFVCSYVYICENEFQTKIAIFSLVGWPLERPFFGVITTSIQGNRSGWSELWRTWCSCPSTSSA